MAYSEQRGGYTINGVTATKNRTSKLIGTWDGGTENSTSIPMRPGDTLFVDVNYSSGTLQLQASPIGQTTWDPVLVNGSSNITSSMGFPYVALADGLLRLKATVGAVAVVTVRRGA
jgi:hypothetical protein